MKHYEWSELDYIAGAAHEMHISYGQYVCMGMPNLQRFKRRVAAGEFDKKPVREKYRKEGQDGEQEKPKRKAPRPEHMIPEGKCQNCGTVIPAEYRSGAAKKWCPTCAYERRTAQRRSAVRKFLEKKNKGQGETLVSE